MKNGQKKEAKQYFERCLKAANNKKYTEYCKANLAELPAGAGAGKK